MADNVQELGPRPVLGALGDMAGWVADKVGDVIEATGVPGGATINAGLDATGALAQGDISGAWDAAVDLFSGSGGSSAPAPSVPVPGYAPAPPPVPAWAEPLGAGAGALAGRAAGAAVGGPTGAAVGQAIGAAAGSALAGWLSQPPATAQPVGTPVPWGAGPVAPASPLATIQASMGILAPEQVALLAVVAEQWSWIAPNLWRAGIGPKGVWSRRCAPLLAKLSKAERTALSALACGAPELLTTSAEEHAYLVGWSAIQLTLVPASDMESSINACKCEVSR